jgi:calcineurin-like phosphoesterase family protein
MKLWDLEFKTNAYFVADTHFGHEDILRHCNRPFSSVEEMDRVLIERWNRMIPNNKAQVYIVGDFAFKDHEFYLSQLNGKKILIMGNHDNMKSSAKQRFKEIHDFGLVRKFRRPDASVSRKIAMCHYKMQSWDGLNEGSYHLYGHSHGRLKESSEVKSMDIGVDVWGYQPIPFEIIEFVMEQRKWTGKLAKGINYQAQKEDNARKNVESIQNFMEIYEP